MSDKLDLDQKMVFVARDQFEVARKAMIFGAKAIQETGYFGDETMNEIKNVIGDLSITVEVLNDVLG